MMKKFLVSMLVVMLLAVPVSAETRCPCGCGATNCCDNYYQLLQYQQYQQYQQWLQAQNQVKVQQPHGYWTEDGYFCIPKSYDTTTGHHVSAGYYPKGELPEEALGYSTQVQAPAAGYYYPSAPYVKPDRVETKETRKSTTTNTTFSVTFPDGVDSQIVNVPGVGTVIAYRNGTFQVLK